MLRLVSEGVVLFVLPFVAYAALLLIQRRVPMLRDSVTDGSFAWLTATGLAFVVVGLLLLGLLGERHSGAYVPAHIDHGTLVPGQME